MSSKSAKTVLESVFTLGGKTVSKELMTHPTYLTKSPYVTGAQIHEAMLALRDGLLAELPEKVVQQHTPPIGLMGSVPYPTDMEIEAANMMRERCTAAIEKYFSKEG